MRAGMLRRLGEWRASLQRSRYLSWIYLFFIALFFLAPTSKSHHQVYYVLVCVPYLLAFRPRGMLTLFRSWTYTLSFLYLGLLALSVAWSDQPSLQAFRRYAFHFAYTLLFLTMTVELVLQDRRLLTHLFRIIMFAAAAGGLISLVAFYSQASSPFERLRALGVLDDPNSAAAVFGSVLLVAYYWGVREGERPVWRALAWFSIAVSLAFVIMTQTRGELLALLTTVIVGAFIVRDATVEKWTAAILFLIAAGFMALAMMDAPFIHPDLTSRGLSYRPEIWSIAFDFDGARPEFSSRVPDARR